MSKILWPELGTQQNVSLLFFFQVVDIKSSLLLKMIELLTGLWFSFKQRYYLKTASVLTQTICVYIPNNNIETCSKLGTLTAISLPNKPRQLEGCAHISIQTASRHVH